MTSPSLLSIVLVLLAAKAVGVLAWRLRALTAPGAIAAAIMGATVAVGGGWGAGILLVLFFVTSSGLPRVLRGKGRHRGEQRTPGQVFANGGVGMIAAVGLAITQHPVWLVAMAGSFAAATADTWSTEIGRTSPTPPRLITTLRPAPPGTSGAISLRGSLGSAAGALTIGLVAAVLSSLSLLVEGHSPRSIILCIAAGGIAGGFMDSLIGATIQERLWCDTCTTPTEALVHRCGTPTRRVGGIPGLNNNAVNLLCSLTGGLVAALLWMSLHAL